MEGTPIQKEIEIGASLFCKAEFQLRILHDLPLSGYFLYGGSPIWIIIACDFLHTKEIICS
jgi:hypothetical protein